MFYTCADWVDGGSICKAAIGAGLAVDFESAVVTFTISEPAESYEGCQMIGKRESTLETKKNQVHIQSSSWKFWEWSRAARPDKVQRYCGDEWVQANGENTPCPATLKKYRQVRRFDLGTIT